MRIAIDLPNYPFAWQIAGGALEFAGEAGDIAILLPHAPIAREDDCNPDTWDGIIVQRPRKDLALPQVSVSAAYRGSGMSVHIVRTKVVQAAIDQFSAMGLSNFAFFSMDEWRLGWNSFSRRVKELGSTPIFINAENPEDMLMKIRKPCGILTFTDTLGLELLDTCKLLGLRVPGDIHVISVGDTPACLDSSPTLSSISMPLARVGYFAAKLCSQMINGESVKSVHLPPSGLIIRESIRVENEELRTVSEVAHYLRSNLAYPVQMEDVVRLANISRRQLERVFRSTYGSSPMAYLKEFRLERAKEMLLTSDAKLKDIARDCGYRDANHLCRIFRESVGVSPGQFREKGQ